MKMSLTRNRQARVVVALLVLACLGALLPSALGAEPVGQWHAEYFANPSLDGTPAVVRTDSAINFDWTNHRPHGSIPIDHWSARWTGEFLFDAGEYLFKAYTDDGIRLWIDGQLVIDQWINQVATLSEKRANVSAGTHSVRVEYYDNIGNAVAKVWWELMSPPTTNNWHAEYYANAYLSGAAVAVRTDPAIDFAYGEGSPGANIPVDSFSARWSSSIDFGPTGTYDFSVTVDDGVRIWIDGSLLIDKWIDQTVTTFTASRSLTQGRHSITVEYYEHTGGAQIHLSWKGCTSCATSTSATATTVSGSESIIDDQDSGFQKGGPADGWFDRAVGYNSHTYWTYNSNAQAYNFAKWVPSLSAGYYQVYVFIPKQRADTRSARYRVYHNAREDSFWVNQSAYFDAWVSIGTHYFAGTANEYVYLDDVTGETYASRNIAFDAVKFVKSGTSSATTVPTATRTPNVVVVTSVPTSTPIVITPAPSSTPYVVTATPSAPTPTKTATSSLPACAIMPVLGFGNIWTTQATVRSRVGCPVEVEKSVWSGEETFQGGLMFWRTDLSLIYVLRNNGTWQSYADTWTSAEAEWDTSIVAPAGYSQPKRGFGKVWRLQPGVRDALGWATMTERGLGATWQAYQGGLMLWSDAQGNFVLFSDGTWGRY
jgi:hypothetical protein